MWETYYTPATLDEAIALLNQQGDSARIIAGGTDIIIELERGMRPDVKTLIDITRIPDLDAITSDDEGQIHLGPLVTHNHVAGSALLVERALPLAQASWLEAAPQIRNRATVVGNLITASPANDTITPLIALDASVTLRSTDGERTVPLRKFYKGVRRTVMQSGELMTGISFKALDPEHERGMFVKLGLRRAQAIAVINVAIVLRLEEGIVTKAKIALGAVAPTIITAPEAEFALEGGTLSNDAVDKASRLAAEAATPIDDVRGSANYRREMVRVLTRRALRELREDSQTDHYPTDPVMLWGPDEGRVKEPLARGFVRRSGDAIETTINGKPMTVRGGADKTLLRFLREDAGLIGTKEGCAEGECGACTVFLDGAAVMSCMVGAPRAHYAEIVTVEGLAEGDDLHPIQQGFVEKAAVQCGYCTPGFLMSGAKLLEERPQPNRDEIEQSITGNLCRCTGYYSIIEAFDRAAELGADKEKADG